MGSLLHSLRAQGGALKTATYLVWQSSPSWTTGRLILVVIQGILPLASLYLTKLIVDAVTASVTSVDKTPILHQALLLVGLYTGVMLMTNLCGALSELINTAQRQRLTDHTQDLLHTQAAALDLGYYEDPEYHDILERAEEEAPYRPVDILDNLVQIGQNGISLLAMVGLLLSLHAGLIGVLFAAALPAMFVKMKFAQVLYGWERNRTSLERQADYLGWLLTSDSAAKEVRLYGLSQFLGKRFRQIRQRLYREKLRLVMRRFVWFAGTQLLTSGVVFLAYAFIVYQTVQGTLKLGDLVLYHQAFQRGQNAMRAVLQGFADLYEDSLFIENFQEFLALESRLPAPIKPCPVPAPLQQGITLENVSFQYPKTTRQALRNVSLTIRPQETIALVGENGCGKTTLVKLLCRLYDPTEGRIALDGIDLKSFEITELHRHMSAVFQDYVQYHLTARENIGLGNIALSDEDAITEAARLSGADPVIRRLPQGYQTVLGKWFEAGEELSGGQWQSIALARAFLRDAPIIILDEPTSALDPKAEYEVFKQFYQLTHNQTAILISHRLATVRMADCIYVMANGSIIEKGTHQELLRRGGTYAQLYETQAKNYR